jgi:chromate reductase, NAD(P)H dehydrogenase (quinone)
MKVLGISGSLRRDSHNTKLLREAARHAPEGVELEILDRELLRAVPPFDEDHESDPPASVEEIRSLVSSADAVLIATPEYNHSIPGWLKNVVDWLSRPKGEAALLGKDVAVAGASTGMFGAVWSQAELRKSLGGAGARVVDEEVVVPSAGEAFNEEGELIDAELRELLAAHVAGLVEAAGS